MPNAHVTRLLPSTSNLGRTVHLARSARTGPCDSLPRFAVSGRTAFGESLSSRSIYKALSVPHEPFLLLMWWVFFPFIFNSLCAAAIAVVSFGPQRVHHHEMTAVTDTDTRHSPTACLGSVAFPRMSPSGRSVSLVNAGEIPISMPWLGNTQLSVLAVPSQCLTNTRLDVLAIPFSMS